MADDTSNGPRTPETPSPENNPDFYGWDCVKWVAYSEARNILDELPGRAVLYWINRAGKAAAEQRHTPDLRELVVAAAYLVERAPVADRADPYNEQPPF